MIPPVKDVIDDASDALGQLASVADLVAAEVSDRPREYEALKLIASHARIHAERLDAIAPD